MTRSGETSESAINTVDVLVFGGTPKTFMYSRYAWQKSGSLYSATLKIGTDQDLYFAINARNVIENANLTEGMSLNEAFALLVMENPESFNLTGTNNGLPMWGCALGQTINDAPSNSSVNNLGIIKLLRSVAAVEVSVTDDTFNLLEGSIAYGANKGLLAFSTANITPNFQSDFRTINPEIPAGMTTTKTWHRIPSGSNELKHVFYLYENDNQSAHTKVILKGEWGGASPTFYPLSLRNPETDDKLPIKRNTKFIIIVTKVNGDGYATWEEARDAEAVNINYDVIIWDDLSDESIMIDGSQFIRLQRSANDKSVDRTAILYRTAGSADSIAFSTNIPLNKFEMQLNNGGGFPDINDKTLIENTRFRAEIKTVNGDNFFKFTALQNYSMLNNPSILTVTTGRITFEITIIQKDADPNDWIGGGEHILELKF